MSVDSDDNVGGGIDVFAKFGVAAGLGPVICHMIYIVLSIFMCMYIPVHMYADVCM